MASKPKAELYSIRVPPEGNPQASIMLVGESPGVVEAQEGRPFVGPTGKQLDQWLGQVGLQRSDLWITNVVKQMPRGDKDRWFFPSPGEPSPEYLAGIEELRSEIERIQPRVIVPMGNYALWALTGHLHISKWRGSILACELVPGPTVVPTIHPSYVLRKWVEYPLLVWDLRRAAEEARATAGQPRSPDYNYLLDPTQDQIDRAVAHALSSDLITIDTEWFSPDDLSCLGFTTDPSWAICIPASAPGAIPAYRAILSSDARKVFQNAMFDCTHLAWAGLPVKVEREDGTRLVEDTMVAHYVTWPQLKKDLGTIASIYTREPYYKDERKVAEASDYSDLNRYWLYNAKDVRVTAEAWVAIGTEMDEMGTRKAYELNMLAFVPLLEGTLLGIRCDHAALAALEAKHKTMAKKYQAWLDGATGGINVRSYPQVRELVYEVLGVPKRAGSPTDQPTLMDIAAQTKSEMEKKVLTYLIRCREEHNVTSKYINAKLPAADGRLRSSWNIAGTKNGRLSASKNSFAGTGASLQTFPAEARKICVADPGYVFLKPDQAQAEARIVAYLAEDWKTIDWLEAGLDIHSKMTEAIYGIPYDEVREGYKAGDKDMTKKRYICKTCKHGTNYRMGKILLRQSINENYHETGFGIDTKEAERIRLAILAEHPLEAWWKGVEAQLAKDRSLTNPFGRKRIFLDRWGSTLLNDAVAFLPQSTAADLNKIGLDRVHRWLKECWPGDSRVGILAEMHDGSLIQVPDSISPHDLAHIVKLLTIPFRVNGHDLTIPVELSLGSNWEDMSEVKPA